MIWDSSRINASVRSSVSLLPIASCSPTINPAPNLGASIPLVLSTSGLHSWHVGFAVRGVRRIKEACEQHCQDTAKKDSIEGSGSAYRGDRRAQPLHPGKMEEVSPDQRAETAADVSKRSGLPARQQQRDDRC